ncbi:MAG: hypothetical protein IPI49_19685 [Myxococcales bacterium]|nr:hypothetical protein [Myxococcales bacterium]
MRKAMLTFFVVRDGRQAPEPAFKLQICAATTDGLLEAATETLQARGMTVRSLSFGPDGLVAYAEVR